MKIFILKCLLLIFICLATVANGQVDVTSIHYRGLRPDDRSGLKPIRNPGRGLMINDTIDLSLKPNLFRLKPDSCSNIRKLILKYALDSITLVHTTLYLPTDKNVTISDSTLRCLQIYLDTLRVMGLKCVIHLTYKVVRTNTKDLNPSETDVNRIRIIPLLTMNKDVVMEIQEGLFGAWRLSKESISDGYKAAMQLKLNQLNELSLIEGNGRVYDPKNNPMEKWRDLPVGPDQLMTEKLPFSEDYFKSTAGNIIQRPMFDYIRDHLGYRIELQQLILPAKRPDNSPIHLKLELINRGFSAVKHSCTVAFVLIDPTGKVYEMPAEGDPASWIPFTAGDVSFKPVTYSIEYKGKLPLHLIPGRYKLGVWIADAVPAVHYDYRYNIRCANGNTGWWISNDGHYGINILTSLTISK